MSYHELVAKLGDDAEQLEKAYQVAVKAGQADAFTQAIVAGRTAAPENRLYAAWFYRLQDVAAQAKGSFVKWGWVIPLAVLNGLLFWWLSDDARYVIEVAGFRDGPARFSLPTLLLLVAPIAGIFVLLYLTAAGRRRLSGASV